MTALASQITTKRSKWIFYLKRTTFSETYQNTQRTQDIQCQLDSGSAVRIMSARSLSQIVTRTTKVTHRDRSFPRIRHEVLCEGVLDLNESTGRQLKRRRTRDYRVRCWCLMCISRKEWLCKRNCIILLFETTGDSMLECTSFKLDIFLLLLRLDCDQLVKSCNTLWHCL